MECESDRVILAECVRKASAPPFLVKTYMMVEDPSTDAVISWNDGGTAFVVRQPAEFARDLLPTLFKHSNFSSFVRQLNTYGFRKVVTNRWEFSNGKFRRGERDLLCEIHRRKATSNKQQHNVQPPQAAARSEHSDSEEQQPSPSTASSSSFSEFTNLADENKRLKRENGALASELEAVKRRCQELLEMVDACEGSLERENQVREGGSRCLKLFGVKMEVECEREETKRALVSQSCK